MKRLILGFVVALGFSAAILSIHPSQALAGIATLEDATKEMTVGKADAPVTMIEYASLGCPHCANFHRDVYPQVKKNYIDTGKVKMIYRDFPLGRPALAATMIARCSGSQRYFGMIQIFFQSQQQWSSAENPLDALKKTARFGGMSSQDVDACLSNQGILDHVQELARKGQEEHKIQATPSFIVNGELISGGLPYDDFKAVLDKALEKAK
jgi:protein-disulfide isomerase